MSLEWFERKFYFLFLRTYIQGNIMKVKPNRTLDCLGLYCPEPVFRTRIELDDIRIGEILEVLADDPAAEADIRSLVKRLEQEIVDVSKDGNTVRILIKKVK
jgi:tRNA 2-thiouridine synthesizing protein A